MRGFSICRKRVAGDVLPKVFGVLETGKETVCEQPGAVLPRSGVVWVTLVRGRGAIPGGRRASTGDREALSSGGLRLDRSEGKQQAARHGHGGGSRGGVALGGVRRIHGGGSRPCRAKRRAGSEERGGPTRAAEAGPIRTGLMWPCDSFRRRSNGKGSWKRPERIRGCWRVVPSGAWRASTSSRTPIIARMTLRDPVTAIAAASGCANADRRSQGRLVAAGCRPDGRPARGRWRPRRAAAGVASTLPALRSGHAQPDPRDMRPSRLRSSRLPGASIAPFPPVR